MSILDWGPLSRVRRNHALEHATLQVMAEAKPTLRMAGYSDAKGFWLVGVAETEEIARAVEQAIIRLNRGEHNLAIHPNCGTNYVAAGFLAGTLAWLGMLTTGRGLRNKLERWPVIVSLVTLATIFAQPLGPVLQERITTSPRLNGMRVTGIERRQRGDTPLHRVLTSG
ncbi:MAG: hypothetical protein HY835_03575 [Anaerolineae bacterium]|nr:hypothetical protein [Anaerolineae bacterium]